jgi:hypothetical protein
LDCLTGEKMKLLHSSLYSSIDESIPTVRIDVRSTRIIRSTMMTNSIIKGSAVTNIPNNRTPFSMDRYPMTFVIAIFREKTAISPIRTMDTPITLPRKKRLLLSYNESRILEKQVYTRRIIRILTIRAPAG